jgi:hypothetical protein
MQALRHTESELAELQDRKGEGKNLCHYGTAIGGLLVTAGMEMSPDLKVDTQLMGC